MTNPDCEQPSPVPPVEGADATLPPPRRPARRLALLTIAGLALILGGAALNVLTSDWYRERQLSRMPLRELGRRAVRTPADDRVQYHLAVKLEAAGRQDDALLAYATAIRVRPEEARSWRRMARLLLSRRDAVTAAGLLQTALERWPSDAGLRAARAEALAGMGLPDQAAAEQKRALEDMRGPAASARDWVTLGRYQFEAQDYAGAVESCHRAIALRDDEPDAQRGLGAALLLLGRTGEALPVLEKACRQAPADPQAHYFLGRAQLAAADAKTRELGRASLREAIRLYPRHTRASFWLGVSLAAAARWRDAVRELEAAVRWDPFMAEARGALAEAYRSLGRKEEARRQEQFQTRLAAVGAEIAKLEAVARTKPGDADLAARLAGLYRAAGRRAQALRAYRAVLAVRPQDEAAQAAVAELQAQE